jgi:hypothetical protein
MTCSEFYTRILGSAACWQQNAFEDGCDMNNAMLQKYFMISMYIMEGM